MAFSAWAPASPMPCSLPSKSIAVWPRTKTWRPARTTMLRSLSSFWSGYIALVLNFRYRTCAIVRSLALFLVHHPVGQVGGALGEAERRAEVEIVEHRVEM